MTKLPDLFLFQEVSTFTRGLVLGVLLALLGTYVDFIGTDLRLPLAFAIIIVVLLFRPAGMFGRVHVKRV